MKEKDLLPNSPLTARTAINVATFGLNAVGICRSVKTAKHTMYTLRRPNVSENGARINGPSPSMITNPVVVAMTSCSAAFKSPAICDIPGVNIDDAKGDRMAIKAIMPTLVSLCRSGQALGFSGSSSVKRICFEELLSWASSELKLTLSGWRKGRSSSSWEALLRGGMAACVCPEDVMRMEG